MEEKRFTILLGNTIVVSCIHVLFHIIRHLFYPAFTKKTLPIQPKNPGAGPTIFIHLNISLTNTFQADSSYLLSQHSPKFSKPPSADLPAPCDRHLGNHRA